MLTMGFRKTRNICKEKLIGTFRKEADKKKDK